MRLDCAVQMRLSNRFIAWAFVLALAALVNLTCPRAVAVGTNATGVLEPSPLCPWREPERDLRALFPAATNFVLETHVLTAMMVPAQKRLGRLLTPSENPLRVYRPIGSGKPLGSILVTRVKGEHGGIELVIGADTNQQVVQLIVQSHREPPIVASAITNVEWLGAFRGKTSGSSFRLAADLPDTLAEARASARAMAEGVGSQLILLGYAESLGATSGSSKAHVHARP